MFTTKSQQKQIDFLQKLPISDRLMGEFLMKIEEEEQRRKLEKEKEDEQQEEEK